MNYSLQTVVLAIASIFFSLGYTQAENLSFSELEARVANIESQLTAQDDIQQVAYCDGCVSDCCSGCGKQGGWYAEVQFNFLRPHFKEGFGQGSNFGKLSEKYGFSPRFIVGFENSCGQGARVRYWNYSQVVPDNLDGFQQNIKFDWDVLDLEATHRFQGQRTDVTLAGGLRVGEMAFTTGSSLNRTSANEFIGLTTAVDIETLLCCRSCSHWSFIYGGRFSLLGGDWDPADSLIVEPANGNVVVFQDDNIVVTEIYTGVEYGCQRCGYDAYCRVTFEMQNWHSDSLGQTQPNGDSIGFLGPGFAAGIGF